MEDSGVKLAVLETQLKEIKESIAEIKLAVTDLVKIKGDLSSQGMLQKAHEEKIQCLKLDHEKLEKAVDKQESFISRLQGAFKLSGVLLGILQALILASGSWAVNTIITSKEEISVLKQTVSYLERQNASITRVLQGSAK